MKKLKLLFIALGAALMLTACGTPAVSTVAQDIPVERITTTESAFTIEEEQVHALRYEIYPSYATDKTVLIDDFGVRDIAKVYVDDDNDIIVRGIAPGTGIISLVTLNNKFVSYSVTITEKTPEAHDEGTTPKIYRARDIAEYFNEHAIEIGVSVTYDDYYEGWLLADTPLYPSTDETKQGLSNAVNYLTRYLPDYVFIGWMTYVEADGVDEPFTYFLETLVNSNHYTYIKVATAVDGDYVYASMFIFDTI